MRILPILFSAPMVRALWFDRKTQTRRLPSTKLPDNIVDFVCVATDKKGRKVFEMKDKHGEHVYINAGPHFQTPHFIPRFAIGDLVYVREHWRISQKWNDTSPIDIPARTMTIMFAAGGSIANQDSGKWEPGDMTTENTFPGWAGKHRQAMHMPRWASRLFIEITDVRIERLQAISEEDALAEGIQPWNEAYPYGLELSPDAYCLGETAARAYRVLWNHINGPGAWELNPFVLAYTFKVHKGSVDDYVEGLLK